MDNTNTEYKWIAPIRQVYYEYHQLSNITPYNVQVLWKYTSELAALMCVQNITQYRDVLRASTFLGFIVNDNTSLTPNHPLLFRAALHILYKLIEPFENSNNSNNNTNNTVTFNVQ